jgi:CRP-like cAMP-binding protein
LFLATFGAHRASTESRVTDRLTSLLEEETFRADDTVFSVGDPPEFCYFMREGRVRFVCEGHAPWIFEGRCAFGMSDALVERSRTRTALAVTDLQLMRMQSDAWIELLEDSFDLARGAVRELARAVAQLEEKVWASAGSRNPSSVAPIVAAVGSPDVLERLATLMDVPLLRGAGVQTLSDLANASEELTFAAGESLFERGATTGVVYVILRGEVQASRTDPEVTWRGGPADIVCGTAAFTESVGAWQARAVTPARALVFRVDDWFDLLEEHFEMVRSTLAALSIRRETLLDGLA